MAFGASKSIWGRALLPTVQQNLALIAQTIARFEPVTMLVRPEELDLAQRLVGPTVELVTAPLDDLWMRDTGPVFVYPAAGGGSKAGVNFNFNGWGEKQAHKRDAGVAAVVTHRAGVEMLESDLVVEGGNIVVDGQGTAFICESSVLNKNRNPKWTKKDVEEELFYLLGVTKTIWLPGIKGKDITDGHCDFYVTCPRPGLVLAAYDPDPKSFDHKVTKQHLDILRSATDAAGRRLEVVVLEAPTNVRPAFSREDDFAAGYINHYVCNGAVIAPEFGDARADDNARVVLQRAYPVRQVVMINIDGVAAGGGGIHCTTQQEPV